LLWTGHGVPNACPKDRVEIARELKAKYPGHYGQKKKNNFARKATMKKDASSSSPKESKTTYNTERRCRVSERRGTDEEER